MRFHRTILCFTFAGFLGVSLPALAADDPADATTPSALFEQLDANKDGKVTKEEVGEDRARFFNRLVRVADKNEDGALTREEFLAGSQPAERPAQPDNSPRRPDSRFGGGYAEEYFKRLDNNGDGKLTLKEIPEPHQERFKPLFDRMGKEEITMREFQSASLSQPSQDREKRLEELFKELDANSDGKATLEEAPEQLKSYVRYILARALKEQGDSVTLEEFKRAGANSSPRGMSGPGQGFGGGGLPMFLRMADADRNGKISKAELAKAVEQFDRFDRNGDGSLDSQEISGFAPGGGPDRANANRNQPANGGQFVDGLLERYDADKDGKLSEKEIAEIPSRNKQRFTEWDANKDGSVTREEITAAMKEAFNRNARESDRPRTRPERPKTED